MEITMKRQMQEAHNNYEQFLISVRERIKQLPDNPKAERIADNIVIIRKNDLNDNWSAEYHNWNWQYEVLSNYLTSDKCTPEKAIKRLEEVIADKKVPMSAVCVGAKGYQNLHPELVKEIDKLFNG